MDLCIGLDCGGSKSIAVIGTSDGKIIGKGRGGASNPMTVGVERTVDSIITAVKNALPEQDHFMVDSMYIGIAGGKPKAVKAVHRALSRRTDLFTFHGKLTVDHDLRIALHSGIPDGNGIVLIAGTGSAAFGTNAAGEDVIVSGWNHWFGETGGYELGIKAIIAATRSYDGRGEKTLLENVIKEKYRLKDMMDLSWEFRSSLIDSPEIATLAPLVVTAALNGDAVAISILSEMIEELECSIKAVTTRLNLSGHVKLVLVGSMFRMDYEITDKLLARVKKWLPEVEFIMPTEHPADAAFQLALQQINQGETK